MLLLTKKIHHTKNGSNKDSLWTTYILQPHALVILLQGKSEAWESTAIAIINWYCESFCNTHPHTLIKLLMMTVQFVSLLLTLLDHSL